MTQPSRKYGSGRSPELDRRTICEEAARIMVEQGMSDYRCAKQKAVHRLGLSPHRSELPSNRELTDAMRVRLRLFDGRDSNRRCQTRLSHALELMALLEEFRPRLVGPLLDGIATRHGTIDLHLFCDTPESAMLRLGDLDIRYRPFDKRMRFPVDRYEQVPGFGFAWRTSQFDVLAFEQHRIREAPLCPVDGRPMRRAGADRVAVLRRELGDGLAAV